MDHSYSHVTFGTKLWYISDQDLVKLQNFQRFAGRRVQRFPKRSPNGTSYYGLGWIRIETYIQIKKMLFLRTFLEMDNSCIQEMVFDARVRSYITGRNNYDNNPFASPIFEMLDTSIRFNLIRSVLEIALGNA